MMKALILAGGYATRLYPLTREYPKPLLKVGDRPIIDYIIEKLDQIEELGEIIVVTNSKFIQHFREWGKNARTQKRIVLVNDLTRNMHQRRGAIGDIAFVLTKESIKEDLLVVGGDNLFDGVLEVFLHFAQSHKPNPVMGVYDIRDKQEAKKYGVVKLDPKNKVIEFQEKPEKPHSTLIAMCLYYFPAEKLRLIGEYLKSKTDKFDATGYYIDWLSKKEPVFGFTFNGRWYDIGHPKIYKEANKDYVSA